MNIDDWTWDTNEVVDWLINDPTLYGHATPRDLDWATIAPDVDVDNVDWEAVEEFLEEE